MKTCVPLLLALAGAAACSDSSVLGPAPFGRVAAPPEAAAAPATRFTIMTQNMYIGADVDAVIAALASGDATAAQEALLAAIDVLGRTDFRARAGALAAEIGRARPHVVGLQEVEDLHIHLGLPGDDDLDFLQILHDSLKGRGLPYKVAGQVTNLSAAPFAGVSVTDHDAILVDSNRVTQGPPTSHTYTANFGTVPGTQIQLIRGFVAVDVTIGGMTIRIASTHLEPDFDGISLADVRNAQASELAGMLGTASLAILLGDFNDTQGSDMYKAVTGAGFTDTWAVLRPPGTPALTCCELPDLSNLLPMLSGRIDYVFVRGIAGPQGRLLGDITTVGDRPGDRVPGPSYRIWPSDHAGVVASFLLPPAQGIAAR